MRTRGGVARILGGAAAALAALIALGGADAPVPPTLGIPGSARVGAVTLEPFAGLPDPKRSAFKVPAGREEGRVTPGTDGLPPPVPAKAGGVGGGGAGGGGGATVAILGDLAPVFASGASDKYLKQAVNELNLLRPDLVLTVGNLVPGMTRDGAKYVGEVERVRGELDRLAMPWYPCAGETDVFSGTRNPADRRFEALYQKYQGPLYYSVDAGSVHVIVLDSEEVLGESGTRGISDAQLRWLRGDLNRTFDEATGPAGGRGAGNSRTRWVIVALHRALWRDAEKARTNGWARAQELLIDFNRRPIVRFEGGLGFNGPGAGAPGQAPRVVALVAGGERAYALDSGPMPADGIRRYVMGPTAAMPRAGEDSVAAVRGMLLLKLEADGGLRNGGKGAEGIYPALIGLGSIGETLADGQMIMPEDVVTGAEREVIDAMAGWGEDVMGIDGVIDERAGIQQAKGLRMRISNPLADKMDMAPRTASTKFLHGSRREGANTFVEGFDLPWEMASRHMLRQLGPGEKYSWEMGFTRGEPGAGLDFSPPAPPQVELLVHWVDGRGRAHEVVLKRRVALAARVRLPVIAGAREETFWTDAAEAGKLGAGGAYAWEIRGDEPRELNPSWQMAADGEKLYVKVRVDDAVASYWPRMAADRAWGGIAGDAVSVAWARDEKSPPEHVRRVWVVPFGPKGPGGGVELWTNGGVGDKATELLRLDPRWGVTVDVRPQEGRGYEVTLALPRELVFGRAAPATAPAATATAPSTAPAPPVVLSSAVMNISVHDNDQGARTWVRSWAKEALGPAAWGRVAVVRLPDEAVK